MNTTAYNALTRIKNSILVSCCILGLITSNSCGKTKSFTPPIQIGSFSVLEEIGDTLMSCDTSYAFRKISVIASKEFSTFNWLINNEQRNATGKSFNLVITEATTLKLKLIGQLFDKTDTTISRSLVVYKPTDVVSPLTGEYLGYNTDQQNDTFTVSVKYWFGSRYNWWPDGAYSISNLPKNYRDTTQNFNGSKRPEIDGIVSSTSYRNMAFDKNGFIPAAGIKGYGTLKRSSPDTLVIDYRIIDVDKYKLTNVIHYLNKRFVGLRR